MIKGIYRVAGADITDQRDCNVYLIDAGSDAILIDAGFGAALDRTIANIRDAGVSPASVSRIILTHCHLDHINAAAALRERLGCRLVMHELDADIVEAGDNRLTAAFCFDVVFRPLHIDERVCGEEGKIPFGGGDVSFIHIPGHTPGSIALFIEDGGKKVLFGQDIAAPLLPDFDCDTAAWRASMEKLLALDADVLCDGHSGIYQPARSVAAYIRHFIRQNGDKGTAGK